MGVLSHLEPKEVFYYFEELSKIPHQTFKMGPIAEYCQAFAKEHNLECIRDEVDNIIIKKPGTAGYENSEPVILQGHMDMVTVKTKESTHDFDNDPLDLFIDGNLIGAKDTTLGGDDGIAIAYALALLASDDIPHPPLEALFTVNEEVDMSGANHIDMSQLSGKICINLDSEEEGIFTVGCAGGFTWMSQIPVAYSEEEGTDVKILVQGLLGGHSGMVIQKQRGNAHKIAARVLYELSKDVDFNIITMTGGQAVNAIASRNATHVVVESDQVDKLVAKVAELNNIIIDEFMGEEPDLSITASVGETKTYKAFDADSTDRLINFMNICPDEVQTYDRSFPGFPETSLNMGTIRTNEGMVEIGTQVRSSVASKLDEMKNRLEICCTYAGASYTVPQQYPAWKYDPNSKVRPVAFKLFKEMFGKEPVIENTHGGLECGILYTKKPDLDIISFGPNMSDVHSVNERMDIASTERMWRFLKEFIALCK